MLRSAAIVLAVCVPANAAAGVAGERFEYDLEHPGAGVWLGTLESRDGRPLHPRLIQLVIEPAPDGHWSIAVTALAYGAAGTAAGGTAVAGPDVAFSIGEGPAVVRFSGRVSDDGQRLEGRAGTADGAGEGFSLARTPRPRDLPDPVRYAGRLSFGGRPRPAGDVGPTRGDLAIALVLAATPGGAWVGELDFPAGGIESYPLTAIRVEGDAFAADAALLRHGTFDGTFSDGRRSLDGHYRQGPVAFQMHLTREAGAPAPAAAPAEPPGLASSWMLRRHLGPPWAIRGVNVIDVETGRVDRDVTIIVAGDQIRSVSRDEPSAGLRTLDFGGRFVIPGLFDLHAHIQPFDPLATPESPESAARLAALLDHGVTTVRALPLVTEFAVDAAGRVNSGVLTGPRIIPAGGILEMRPQRTPFGFGDPQTSRQWVERDAMLGARWIKVYNAMDEASLRAIVETASARGLRVCGHAEGVGPREASEIGLGSIEHVVSLPLSFLREGAGEPPRGLPEKIAWRWANVDDGQRALLLDLLARNGTALVPTLVVVEQIARAGTHDGVPVDAGVTEGLEAALAGGARFAVDLHRRGGLVGLGTDFPVDGVEAGSSAHRELELLVASGGATPLEALRIATLGSAQVLGLSEITGAIRPGFAADLVVLGADPLQDISNTRRIELVVHDGREHRPAAAGTP